MTEISELLDQLDQAHATAIVAEHNALPRWTAALRAVAELADELDAESGSAMARADQMEQTEENVRHHAAERRHARVAAHAAASIRAVLTAALTPGADTAGATA